MTRCLGCVDAQQTRSDWLPVCLSSRATSVELWRLIDFQFQCCCCSYRFYFPAECGECCCCCKAAEMTRGNSFWAELNAVLWTHLALCRKFPVPESSSGWAGVERPAFCVPEPPAAGSLPSNSCPWSRGSSAKSLNCMATASVTHSCRSCGWSPTTKPNQARSTCISSCRRRENDESRYWNGSRFSTPASAHWVRPRRWSYPYRTLATCRPDGGAHTCRSLSACSRWFCPSVCPTLSSRRSARRRADFWANKPWRGMSARTAHC